MSEALPRDACWEREDAETILRIEALGGDDTLFLATHTPIRNFGLAGAHRQDLEEPTESALLDTLSNPKRQHAFCVVQGDPGSGKSHLIRWLAVHWPDPEDVVLLLQRADGSLQGALEQLQTKLTRRWPEFAPLFDRLDKRQKTRIAGRAAMFHSALGVLMMPDAVDQPFDDAAYCDRHDLSLLIQSRHVRSWAGPRRILELIDGKAEARNSESARFGLGDVLDLARLCGALDDSTASQRFAQQLRAEALKVGDWQDLGEGLREILRDHADELPASTGLIRALNLRLNDAVQRELGVSGEDLVVLFRKVREALVGRARLILLLEDITAWQGLDNSLIDALVLDADTRADIAPLISVVGVTPDYYDALQKNYLDRITHEIRLSQASDSADAAVTLRAQDDRLAFAARYLNATRAGAKRLDDWRHALAADRTALPPNRCRDCRHQIPCHAVFGAVDDMGLYPFTPNAVEGLFMALKTDDKGQTHRTPRGLLQNVLGPTLRNPSMLHDQTYPGADLETEKQDERARRLSGPMRALVDSKTDDASLRERLRRTIVYWGNPARPQTTRGPDGVERFADVPAPIFEAFGLPWPGGAVTTVPPSAPNPHPPPSLIPPDAGPVIEVPPAGSPSTTPGLKPAEPSAPEAAAPVPAARPPARPSPTSKTKLQRLQAHIQDVREANPATVPEPGLWNEVLHEMLRLLEPRQLGIDPFTWNTLFTTSLVQVQGAGAVRGYSFGVTRDPWLYDGLEAYCALKSGQTGGEEFHRRRLAFALRRLSRLVVAHVRRRNPPLPDGGVWDMAATATQVLLARAWLQGAVRPDAPTHEQWRVVLSDNPGSATDPTSRTEPWRDALRNTDQQHEKLRPMLRDLVSLPQGTSTDFGVAATGSAARAILRLRDRFTFLPISEAAQSTALIDDRSLRTTAAKMRDYMARIPAGEFKLLQDRATQLNSYLRDEGLRARAARLDAAVTKSFQHLRGLPEDPQRKWREDWRRISTDLAKADTVGAVQALIVAFETPEAIPDMPAQRLGWLVGQPAGDLKAFVDFMRDGEALAALLLDHAQAMVKAAGAGADLSKLQQAGEALRTHVAAARARWTGGLS